MSAIRYIRFVEISSRLIRDSRIPLYSSKFSKTIYSQHQLLTLLFLKEYLAEDYRDAVELTKIMDSLREKIHLDKVPHFTTIQKFCQRIRSFTFTRLLNRLQIKEIKIKVVLYNLSRLISLFVILIIVEEFFKAIFSKLFIIKILSAANYLTHQQKLLVELQNFHRFGARHVNSIMTCYCYQPT